MQMLEDRPAGYRLKAGVRQIAVVGETTLHDLESVLLRCLSSGIDPHDIPAGFTHYPQKVASCRAHVEQPALPIAYELCLARIPGPHRAASLEVRPRVVHLYLAGS